uniref:Uncharacterized protein n=1 Tax=Rhipicephalus zambeziensis TaxID=60191 RepID=A0A224Y907_9ACAR
MGSREWRPLLAGRQLVEHRVGRQRLLQDSSRIRRVWHRRRRRCRPSKILMFLSRICLSERTQLDVIGFAARVLCALNAAFFICFW